MLKVDLTELERERRLVVHREVPSDAALWEGIEATLTGPISVDLEVSRIGPDIMARGTLEGAARLDCKRCLSEVDVEVDEPVEFFYRAGLTEEEAKREEAYALPKEDRDLDLTEAIREHMVLAVPLYALCDQACEGLCPRCGARLNETTCDCEETEVDDRWAPLRKLQGE